MTSPKYFRTAYSCALRPSFPRSLELETANIDWLTTKLRHTDRVAASNCSITKSADNSAGVTTLVLWKISFGKLNPLIYQLPKTSLCAYMPKLGTQHAACIDHEKARDVHRGKLAGDCTQSGCEDMRRLVTGRSVWHGVPPGIHATTVAAQSQLGSKYDSQRGRRRLWTYLNPHEMIIFIWTDSDLVIMKIN